MKVLEILLFEDSLVRFSLVKIEFIEPSVVCSVDTRVISIVIEEHRGLFLLRPISYCQEIAVKDPWLESQVYLNLFAGLCVDTLLSHNDCWAT
jgi:hypothetical protein